MTEIYLGAMLFQLLTKGTTMEIQRTIKETVKLLRAGKGAWRFSTKAELKEYTDYEYPKHDLQYIETIVAIDNKSYYWEEVVYQLALKPEHYGAIVVDI